MRNPGSRQIASDVAHDLGLPLVILSATLEDENTSTVRATSPEQFVGLFRDASFVVCSSFHGTIFSLLYHCPFYSVRMGKGKDNRVQSVLGEMNLEAHFISSYHHGDVKSIMHDEWPSLTETALVQQSFQFLHQYVYFQS